MDYRGGEGDKFNTHDRVIYIFIILFIQTHRLLKTKLSRTFTN